MRAEITSRERSVRRGLPSELPRGIGTQPRRRASDTRAKYPNPTVDGNDQQALDKLWETFWTTKDASARNDLIVAHMYLVDIAVRRLPSTLLANWRSDDLHSFGAVGLINAVDRRRRDLASVPFASYALYRIRGAIIDELRGLDWLPRTLRRRVIQYRETEDALLESAQHSPTRGAVLAAMEVTSQPQVSATLLAVRQSQFLSMQDPIYDDDNLRSESIASLADPEEAVMIRCDREELKRAIDTLTDRKRAIITYRFLGGFTQRQVAELLGVSGARISGSCDRSVGALSS